MYVPTKTETTPMGARTIGFKKSSIAQSSALHTIPHVNPSNNCVPAVTTIAMPIPAIVASVALTTFIARRGEPNAEP